VSFVILIVRRRPVPILQSPALKLRPNDRQWPPLCPQDVPPHYSCPQMHFRPPKKASNTQKRVFVASAAIPALEHPHLPIRSNPRHQHLSHTCNTSCTLYVTDLRCQRTTKSSTSMLKRVLVACTCHPIPFLQISDTSIRPTPATRVPYTSPNGASKARKKGPWGCYRVPGTCPPPLPLSSDSRPCLSIRHSCHLPKSWRHPTVTRTRQKNSQPPSKHTNRRKRGPRAGPGACPLSPPIPLVLTRFAGLDVRLAPAIPSMACMLPDEHANIPKKNGHERAKVRVRRLNPCPPSDLNSKPQTFIQHSPVSASAKYLSPPTIVSYRAYVAGIVCLGQTLARAI
jgi:hypothetical protein